MHAELINLITQHIQAERLPETFIETINHYYLPVAQQIANWRDEARRPIVIGINGAQGSGKSTMAGFLQVLLQHGHGLPTAVISIDDLYLTKSERKRLAREVHPLFITRGCPGTHDINLGIDTINRLIAAGINETIAIPSFDKAMDDRREASHWKTVTGTMQVVILEGWCVGATPQSDDMLTLPVNDLERLEDAEGTWRYYANRALGQSYQQLFGMLDHLIMLKVPGFACVQKFRMKQEEKLRQKIAGSQAKTAAPMSPEQVRRFIMHYQRLTQWILRKMPSYADLLLEVESNHQIVGIKRHLARQ